MDKPGLLPAYVPQAEPPRRGRRPRVWSALFAGLLVCTLLRLSTLWPPLPRRSSHTLQKCRSLNVLPGPPPDFNTRPQSDRFVEGTRPTLIRNATIWTGRNNGLEILTGDILLDKGLIKAVGHVQDSLVRWYGDDLVHINAQGSWVSPGIVDLHSHLGVYSAPALSGASDGNSRHGPVLPWLRSLDALNTRDDAYRLSISGGVTTALVLPGSANAIGGQAFPIKLRPTKERSPSSMLLEPPYGINGSEVDPSLPPRWRHIKQACGENPDRVYSGTRMDTMWAFRQGYEHARQIKEQQDAYCAKAEKGLWDGLGAFPEDLQWEALVDVLRGRVKIQNHCYETVDLEDIVRLSNEFKFPIAAFHHAHETYLVPGTLKKAYGHPPAIALFATNARYKRESYRGSEFAPRILADEGLQVVMKSDHPVLNSRYLLFEAQQAHYYGLPANLALAAVTSTPATVMGEDHRIGYVKEGYDADLVIWDSHPLALGATPKQVWIDGIAQLDNPHAAPPKPDSFQSAPATPDFDKEARDALEYEGLPPLLPEHAEAEVVVFTNVGSVYVKAAGGVRQVFLAKEREGVVVVRNGEVVCQGACDAAASAGKAKLVDLKGGAISPGLTAYGSPLALQEIQGEVSTQDGYALDPLSGELPKVLGGDYSVMQAVDGLQYATRDALIAYRSGVTTGISAPKPLGFLSGLSVAFSTGAAHKLEKGAVVQDVAALHVSVGHGGAIPSVSTQVAALRRLLGSEGKGDLGRWFERVREGKTTLVVTVQNADVMATLIRLKREVEAEMGHSIKLTFAGATEAHLLAKEIGENGVGVLLTPPRPYPGVWEERRVLPGPPLTRDSSVSLLLAHNVTVGIGTHENWAARNIRFDAAWAALESHIELSKSEALSLASVNVEELLGLSVPPALSDLVATTGGDLLDFSSKVVGVISPRRGVVDLL
ncbi:carbohydrate esterase family 9 protein [Gloeophyllum trabeum ATCC 11539]|uniref:Carbohydrate esterase family 9 protein n=1 Tax=Gloeophyllum trabeum (strain ATCC 11539 / FP-39264 / Madison 617) TaxID=670483 RepID=S7RRX7_GLOTA|nr:carbohydrate esterase family 9 protein [Gloeophyllum trabeum ATCC 11539]EPQ57395.1 carbohydrate esterase family 9 protein [Gloeophyllum trabeum ATCC 11539]